ncbi:hypothetical protein GCM10022216_32510 [Sphingobacterium kyonggiense]|uniref:ABC-three component systems C-terminal domain-containing protein n=1 Tax=Sphingobacterium kyonggiense TaxID=714075 RepID=A0ABP7Z497_9SPHI
MSNRNATASWSGYSHQGLVGLLVAIKEIRRLISENKQGEFGIHFLEYENNEDVAISREEMGSIKELLSVHQIKAYYSQGHLINTYKSVFTGAPIYQLDANGKLSKDDDGKKIETGNYNPGQWCNGSNYLHVVENITNWPTDNDFSSVGGNPNSIERFEYEAGVFHCGTNQIDQYIIDSLKSIDFHMDNEGLASMALKRLCFELDSKIRSEHATKSTKNDYEIRFSFDDLIGIINSNIDVSTNDIYICRKLFYDSYNEAKKNSSLDAIELSEIDKLIDQIYHGFSDDDFLLFIRRLSLNRNPKHQHNTHSVFNPDGLKQVFFKLLLNLPNIYPEIMKEEFTLHYSSLRYVLTTIIDEKDDAKDVVQNILNNLDSHKLLWEKTSLINKEINGTFHDLNPDFFDVRKSEDKAMDFTEFMQYNGSTTFICRDTAKINLTNGSNN